MKKKILKFGFYCFFSGFFVFSGMKFLSKKNNELNKKTIIKLLSKITNFSIHILFQRYDNKKLNNKISENNNNLNNKNSNNNNKNSNKNTLKTLENESETNFDIESAYMLFQIETEKISKFNITPKEYYNYLSKFIEDEEIYKNIIFIKKAFTNFEKRFLPQFNFGEILPKKYLEIVSNIFYFNLQITTKLYYIKINNYPLRLSFKEKNLIFNNLYSKHLKNTRNLIINFFKIENNLDLNIKTSLRIFPYYFDINHPLRKKYIEMNDCVNTFIIYILNSEEKIDELINENNKNYLKNPIDKIIDFTHFLNNKNKNLLLNNNGEIPFEDQLD